MMYLKEIAEFYPPFNKVAKKMGTDFEMGTDGQRFVYFQSGIDILRRCLRGVSVYIKR